MTVSEDPAGIVVRDGMDERMMVDPRAVRPLRRGYLRSRYEEEPVHKGAALLAVAVIVILLLI